MSVRRIVRVDINRFQNIFLFTIFRDLIDEALTFHLIPERRALIQSFRTEPRVCDIKGYIFVVGGLNRHGN